MGVTLVHLEYQGLVYNHTNVLQSQPDPLFFVSFFFENLCQ
jgi:hypothetical protein